MPKDNLPRKAIREIEAEILDIQRELDEGRHPEFERTDLWLEPEAYQKHLYSEKHIIKAFVMGVLTAHVWNCDLFQMPDGFTLTIEHVSKEVQLLRFGDPKNGRIRMSVNEIIDKHMRLWIQQDENCQRWIRTNVLDPKCVLRAACDVLNYERAVFDRECQKTIAEARAQIEEDLLKQQPKLEKPPSGLRPAIQA